MLFIVHPTQPLDPSNPRTKPSKQASGGGAIRPAYWFIDLRKTGKVGRGQPPTTILGRKRKADVVIECRECCRCGGRRRRVFARCPWASSLAGALSRSDGHTH